MRAFFIILVSFTLICCNDRGKEFEYFEISYANCWLGDYSFAIKKNREYYLEKEMKVLKGKLSEEEFEKLNEQIFEIENANLKSYEACCDVNAFCIIIKKDSKTIRIVQQGEVDNRILELSKNVKEILSYDSNQASDSLYHFKTKSGVIAMPKYVPISK